MKQLTRGECEALKRFGGDSVGRAVLQWLRNSRDEYLEKAFMEGARGEDKLANIEKAALLTEVLKAVDEAPAILAAWPEDEDPDGF